jgi:hypothetical protein
MTMTTLDSSFEDDLQEALLDDVHAKASGIEGMMMLIAETNWRSYAESNGYDIDHVWRDAESEVEREADAVRISAEWPFSAQFEHGVDPHTIEATNADVLAFPWPEMKGVEFGNTGQTFDEVFAETWPVVFFPEVDWGSETGGIPAARAVRNMLRELRGELQG